MKRELKGTAEYFTRNIKAYRQMAQMSQQQVADKLGVAVTTVSSWETGAKQPGFETVDRLAILYRTPAEYFFKANVISANSKSINDEGDLFITIHALATTLFSNRVEADKDSAKVTIGLNNGKEEIAGGWVASPEFWNAMQVMTRMQALLNENGISYEMYESVINGQISLLKTK